MNARSKLQSGQAIAQALLAVGLAVAIHAVFPAFFSSRWPFAPFALAVLASCRWGGRSAGSAATFFSAIALYAWFLPAAHSFWDEGRLGLAVFVAAGFFVSAQTAVSRTANAKPGRLSRSKPASTDPLPMFEYRDNKHGGRVAA